MNFFTKLFSTGVKDIVDSVGNAIDKNITSDEEKIILKNELITSVNQFKSNMEDKLNEFERNITQRWTSDNEHIITRLVRPLSFAWVIFVFTFIAITDTALNLNVKEVYIPVFEALLQTMTVAYFGSRGIEKGIKYFKGEKNG